MHMFLRVEHDSRERRGPQERDQANNRVTRCQYEQGGGDDRASFEVGACLVKIAEDPESDLRAGDDRDDVQRHIDQLHDAVVARSEIARIDRQHHE